MVFRGRALTVIVFAVAMAYMEAAVVVYLQRALDITPDQLFPLRGPEMVGDLAAIEVGREFATLVMLAGIGWLTGRSWLERLAWAAVAFGVWDVFYYVWLWIFVGWPHSPGTWDVLFLIPVPWVGPVWAPVVVSAALVGFGLAAARRAERGVALRAGSARSRAGTGRRPARGAELHRRRAPHHGRRSAGLVPLAALRGGHGLGGMRGRPRLATRDAGYARGLRVALLCRLLPWRQLLVGRWPAARRRQRRRDAWNRAFARTSTSC